MKRGPLNSGHDKPSLTYNNVKMLWKKTSREWLKIALRTVFRINKLIQIRWGKFKPEMNMKRKKHSVEFVLLFEFVPLALGKLVYSEEPLGDGSLRLYVNKLLSLFRPQENKSSCKYSYRRLVLANFPMCQNAVSITTADVKFGSILIPIYYWRIAIV